MHPESEQNLATDPALANVLAELSQREPIFHRPELGITRADFDNMMHPDFWEIGASGRCYSREYVLAELVKRYSRSDYATQDVWETSGFDCRELAPGLYLLTYALLQDNTRKTRRSTLWRRTESGWKVLFHQGTVVAEP
jgi:hypothetical protein